MLPMRKRSRLVSLLGCLCPVRRETALLTAAALSGCAPQRFTSAPPISKDLPASITVFYPAANFSVEPEENGQVYRGGFSDYRSVVRAAAAKDRTALARFLDISANTPFDAAGGEQHQSTVCQMLLRWGDHDFAEVLRTRPVVTRKQILLQLTRSSNKLAVIFPLTTAAAQS